MLLRQFSHTRPAVAASYLFGCGSKQAELASTAEDGARALFAGAERLRRLPDYLEVLPGAFAGSVCDRGLSGKATSTIGFERRFNHAFAIEHEESFIQAMLRDIPAPPPQAAETRARNLGKDVAAA